MNHPDAEWGLSAHGVFLKRKEYRGADQYVFIDLKANTIMDHSSAITADPQSEPTVVAGPFPNLDAAKAAYIVIYGRGET